MCKRHSFILTRAGKVHDGYGVTDSHTVIRELAGLHANDDTVNAYEWQPPKGWPDADWNLGLTKDTEVFETKASHEKAIERHILSLYPTMKEWEDGDKIRNMGNIESFSGYLDLSGLTSLPDGVTFPKECGSLDLRGLTSLPDVVTFPKECGYLYLSGLTSLPEGVTFPKECGYLYLRGLTSLPDGVTFPKECGYLYLSDSVRKQLNKKG